MMITSKLRMNRNAATGTRIGISVGSKLPNARRQRARLGAEKAGNVMGNGEICTGEWPRQRPLDSRISLALRVSGTFLF